MLFMQFQQTVRGSDRGFTLVELMVVIGIIVVLISILFPSILAARNAAINVDCQSRLRQCGVAISLYLADNKFILPHGDNGNGTTSWSRQLAPYLGIEKKTVGTFGYYPGLVRKAPNALECPVQAYRPPESVYKTYAYNYFLAYRKRNTGALVNWPAFPNFHFYKSTQLATPAHKIILQDTSYGGGWIGYMPDTPNGKVGGLNSDHQTALYPKHGKRNTQGSTNYKNVGTTFNALFCDGHVQAMYPKEVGTASPDVQAEKDLAHQYYDLFTAR
jgi:prepilin-type N-terminal cleavage/methylation domain-containing protein/prepilin-type processing-associated H-X9-DG protein